MLADAWADLLKTLLKLLDRFGGLFAAFKAGQGTEKLKQAEKERDDAKSNAKGWANRPRDYNEFSDRMRRRAKRDD